MPYSWAVPAGKARPAPADLAAARDRTIPDVIAPGLRVLFTTGYTRNAILHNGRLDRGVHFIAKPFSLAALAAKIREVLEAPAQEVEIEAASPGPPGRNAG